MKLRKSSRDEGFDLAIFGLGYESRSIHICKEKYSECGFKVAVGYETNVSDLYYADNRLYFESVSCEILERCDSDIFKDVGKLLDEQLSSGETKNVLFDITAFTRTRIATVLKLLFSKLSAGSTLTVMYSPSVYVSPPAGVTPVKKISAIDDYYSGVLGDLGRPVALVLPLGYEKNKALGLVNYLDASRHFILVPRSSHSEFEVAVRDNNKEIISDADPKDIFVYDVEDPYSTYVDMKALVLSAQSDYRPVIVPLGPKVVCAISVFIAHELYPNVPVWRVSSNHSERPVERQANGKIVKFTIDF